MIHLSRPSHKPDQVFDICVSLCEKPGLRRKCERSKETFLQEVASYEKLGRKARLCEMDEDDGVEGGADGQDFIGLYGRLLDSKRPGRAIYDAIKAIPEDGLCPYCAHREIKSLDHYLPKQRFSIFSVAPINLIPCCDACNKEKLSKAQGKPSKQFIHPYFDVIPEGEWLKMEVRHTSPASFLFSAEPPTEWPIELRSRIRYHFSELKLGRLYTIHAGKRLSNIRGILRKRLNNHPDKVREWLIESAESAGEVNGNSWETVFFKTCAKSNWFCDGGFLKK